MSLTDLGSLPGSDDDERVLAARALALAVPVEESHAATELHVVLRVGDHRLGIPADRARHVAPPRHLTPVPAGPPAVVGVAALLGGIVAVADLADLVGAASGLPREQRPLLVVGDGVDVLALLVDAVEELVALEVAAIDDGGPGDGALTGAPVGGLRRLDLDALLADPRLAPPDSSSSEPSQGAS